MFFDLEIAYQKIGGFATVVPLNQVTTKRALSLFYRFTVLLGNDLHDMILYDIFTFPGSHSLKADANQTNNLVHISIFALNQWKAVSFSFYIGNCSVNFN